MGESVKKVWEEFWENGINPYDHSESLKQILKASFIIGLITAHQFYTSDTLVGIGPENVGKKIRKFASDLQNFIDSDKKEKEEVAEGVANFYHKKFKKFN